MEKILSFFTQSMMTAKTAIYKALSLIASNKGGFHGGPKPVEVLKVVITVMDMVDDVPIRTITKTYFIKNTTESIRDNTVVYNFIKLLYFHVPPRPYLEISRFKFMKDSIYRFHTNNGVATAETFTVSDTEKLLYNE